MQAAMPDTSWRYEDPTADNGSRTYAMFMHIVSALSVIDVSGVVLLIATFIMWRVKRKDSPFIDDHGREVVNFQISLYILFLAGLIGLAILTVVLSVVTMGLYAAIGWLPFVLGAAFLWVLRLVGTVRGAIAANKGEIYRYPMCVRVIPG